MTKFQNLSLFLLRISMGWLMFYAGITKVLNPEWTAKGYLESAKTFSGFYQTLAAPNILPVINFINEWGLVLIGVSLVLGLFARLSSFFGIVLMFLYYFPILDFPYPSTHAFLVDQHIIYAASLFVLASFRAGRVWGLDIWCASLPICSKFPKLRNILG